mmetsp:Transcript_107954/g.305988  ORF Transcript_107954/g.305988 Transcript_107954/m.305988 type:complete len:411 (+) Transcript_107954:521-1753(+)
MVRVLLQWSVPLRLHMGQCEVGVSVGSGRSHADARPPSLSARRSYLLSPPCAPAAGRQKKVGFESPREHRDQRPPAARGAPHALVEIAQWHLTTRRHCLPCGAFGGHHGAVKLRRFDVYRWCKSYRSGHGHGAGEGIARSAQPAARQGIPRRGMGVRGKGYPLRWRQPEDKKGNPRISLHASNRSDAATRFHQADVAHRASASGGCVSTTFRNVRSPPCAVVVTGKPRRGCRGHLPDVQRPGGEAHPREQSRARPGNPARARQLHRHPGSSEVGPRVRVLPRAQPSLDPDAARTLGFYSRAASARGAPASGAGVFRGANGIRLRVDGHLLQVHNAARHFLDSDLPGAQGELGPRPGYFQRQAGHQRQHRHSAVGRCGEQLVDTREVVLRGALGHGGGLQAEDLPHQVDAA